MYQQIALSNGLNPCLAYFEFGGEDSETQMDLL